MTRISVILPFFEGELYIEQCLDSLVNALTAADEIILIDDGHSASRMLRILVEKFNKENHSTILYHRNKTNIGLAASLNQGINLSRGKFIARMDQDDICLPHRFEVQLRKVEEGGYNLVFGGFYLKTDGAESCSSHPGTIYSKAHFAAKLHLGNFLCHGTFFAERRFFDVVGPYRSECEYAEDYNLWIRALYKGCCFGICTEELIIRRVHQHQMSQRRWFQRWRTCVALYNGLSRK